VPAQVQANSEFETAAFKTGSCGRTDRVRFPVTTSRLLWNPPYLVHKGYRQIYNLSPAIRWPQRDADHSPPPSVKVYNAWTVTSTPPSPISAM
jgi:hypothetical protein